MSIALIATVLALIMLTLDKPEDDELFGIIMVTLAVVAGLNLFFWFKELQ